LHIIDPHGFYLNKFVVNYSFDGRSVMRLTRVREVLSSNHGHWAGQYTALQTVRHHFIIFASSYAALALCRGDGHR